MQEFSGFSREFVVVVALAIVFLVVAIHSRTSLSIKNESVRKLESDLSKATLVHDQLQIEVAKLQKEREFHIEQLQWVDKTKKEMQDAFQALASQSLQVNTDEFLKHAREQFSSLLGKTQSDWQTQKAELQGFIDPLRQNLTAVDGYVRELEQRREGAYQGLHEQINYLNQAQSELRHTTTTLAPALKSSSVRGRWGEVQLRRIVELAGMTERIDFEEQVATDDGRPDMIIRLPNGGVIPIDSKVPMEAYLEAFFDENESSRQQKIKDHIKAVKSRINLLSQKKYWAQFEHSPDFVIMFVPSEACISAAFEMDKDLLEQSFDKKVMITTPITLLALLKVIAFGWQQYFLSENARKIVNEARDFYSRLESFTGNLESTGKHLNSAVLSYNKTVGSFQGRLLPIARRFEALQVNSSEMSTPNEIDESPRSMSTPAQPLT